MTENIFFIKLKSTSSFARLIIEIPAIIKKYKIDFAHFQYIIPPVKKCKFIVTTHDVIFNEFPQEFSKTYRLTKNFLYKSSAKKADILTTVSEYSKQSIEKYLDIQGREIIILPNGVAPHFFEEHDKDLSSKYIKENYDFEKFILYVSRIEPRKNLVLLVKAYLDLKLYHQGYYLVLLGKKSMEVKEFDLLIKDLTSDIQKFIFVSDSVNDNDLLEFYGAASVFVYPSKAEGFGIPPLEAAATKTPVLCLNTSAITEFSFFGENHIDPSNYEAFKGDCNIW